MAEAGKVALITGAASGIGKHLAQTLHNAGATLIIADINEEGGKSFAEELNKGRVGSAFFHPIDISKWESQVAFFEWAVQTADRIDYVFANAGVISPSWLPPASSSLKRGDPFSKPDIRDVHVNAVGTIYTANLAIQVFRRQERIDGLRGKLVITASVAGIYAVLPPSYVTSKHALVGLIRSLAIQHAPEGITVNGVAPNVTRSEIIPSKEFWDEWEAKGWLTSNEAMSNAFISFLGNNKDNGLIKEVTRDTVTIRLAPEPANQLTADILRYTNTLSPSELE